MQISLHTNVTLHKCRFAQMLLHTNVAFRKCRIAQMSLNLPLTVTLNGNFVTEIYNG